MKMMLFDIMNFIEFRIWNEELFWRMDYEEDFVCLTRLYNAVSNGL